MDLVIKTDADKKETGKLDSSLTAIEHVSLSPSQQVLANVQTEKIKTMQFSGEKTFNGYVKMNEQSFAHISTRASGKIIKMYANFEGQPVRKGEPVFELYSPQLIATQKEFFLAVQNYEQISESENEFAIDQAKSMVEAARNKLKLFEMTSKQIEDMEQSKEVKNSLTHYSSVSGTILKKYVHVGHWATEGEDIYDVADLSNVWIIANIYESDMQYIKQGQRVEITSDAYPGEVFGAKINFIVPVFNPETRTLEVRIDVSNSNGRLKPEMYVKVMINTFSGQYIGVPKSAVIRSGERDIVYIEKEKGIYVPKDVSIATESNGYYGISNGLSEGDVIVVSGGFLIDSETQIQKGFTYGHEGHSENPGGEEEFKINPEQDIMKDMKK
jgi:Cu(I)/Ag(I) efflux system membrane fusion protein